MLVALDTGYADTTAADLSFALGLPAQPALRSAEIAGPGGILLTLRLLGASHQIVLSTVDTDAACYTDAASYTDAALTETVACLPGSPPGLPAKLVRSLPGVRRYGFRSSVRRFAPARFQAEAARLRGLAVAGPPGVTVLAGAFPGSADALTLLATGTVDASTVRWWTYHAYPQTGEIVQTHSIVELATNRGAT